MRRIAILLALVVLLLPASSGLAQGPVEPDQPGDYHVPWWTADGGGDTHTTGGDYILGGTAGQPDAGGMVGGEYTMTSGFLGGAAIGYHAYLPLVMRSF